MVLLLSMTEMIFLSWMEIFNSSETSLVQEDILLIPIPVEHSHVDIIVIWLSHKSDFGWPFTTDDSFFCHLGPSKK